MAIITMTYNTANKTMGCKVDDGEITNIKEIMLYERRKGEYSFSLVRADKDEDGDMMTYTHMVANIESKKIPREAEASPYEGLVWWATQARPGDGDIDFEISEYFA